MKQPVVVVGAGPVGMVAAHLLGREGLPTVVVERDTAVHPLPRAVHLDDEALRVLAGLGLGDLVVAQTRPVPGMQLVTAADRPFWHFRNTVEPGHNGWPASNLFHQPTVDRALRAGLARHPAVDLRLGVEVVSLEQVGGLVRLGVRDGGGRREALTASAVLACDGARSTVRRLLGVGLRDRGLDQRWLVVDTVADRPLPPFPPQQVCDPRRPSTYVPIGGDRHRFEFLLREGERESDLLAADLAERTAPWAGDAHLEIERQATYRFHAVRAARWRVGRVFLVGDAAHQMPPFLGQGLCAGIRDAANLAWKLGLVLRGQAPDALLDTYQRERAAHVDLVTTLAMALGHLLNGRGVGAACLRGGLAAAAHLPAPLRRPLEHVPTPGLRAGPLVLPGLRPPGLRAVGHTFPQATVRTANGAVVPLDEVLGDGFALVSLDAAPLPPLWQHLGARAVRIGPGHVEDPTGALSAWFRRARARTAIVRPDRYILAACTGPALPSLPTATRHAAPLLQAPARA